MHSSSHGSSPRAAVGGVSHGLHPQLQYMSSKIPGWQAKYKSKTKNCAEPSVLFEDGRVWEDLPEIAVRRHLPPAVHLLERLCVAAVLRVTGGRGREGHQLCAAVLKSCSQKRWYCTLHGSAGSSWKPSHFLRPCTP